MFGTSVNANMLAPAQILALLLWRQCSQTDKCPLSFMRSFLPRAFRLSPLPFPQISKQRRLGKKDLTLGTGSSSAMYSDFGADALGPLVHSWRDQMRGSARSYAAGSRMEPRENGASS